MTLAEKQELIKSATTEEELQARMKEIEEDKETVEETKPDNVADDKKKSGEITPEEERKLLKKTETPEQRNVQVSNIIEKKGESKMDIEVRNSKEYINAYAEYLKTILKKDYEMKAEERALLTTNTNNTGNYVEVPDLVYDTIKTAWEREQLMTRVSRISVKGNFKVEFEVSADEAVVHTEGGDPVPEEGLALGVVTLIPESIKKWISVSDEVIDMRGEEFLRYIYDELTYRIAKKTANLLISKIAQLPQTLQANASGIYDKVSANKIYSSPSIGVTAKAIANLSDETDEITVVMNKLTYADFKEAQYGANFPVDPFEGKVVVFNNSLPAYQSATAGAVYMIVGDFRVGALANYPEGDDISLKYDDKTLMTQDLVRILGRKYTASEAVADKAFTLVAKPEQGSI